MAPIDPDLLRSPHSDSDSERSPVTAAVGIAIVVLFVAAFGTWMLVQSGGDGEEPADATGSTTLAGAVGSVALASYSPDPPLLSHPTVLPEGWTVCSLTNDLFDPDRFCGDGEDQWVEVEYFFPRPSDPETAVPAGLHDGEWTSSTEPLELRVPINEHVTIAVRSHGLEAEDVLEIADSIPMVSDRSSLYGEYELPIDWESMTGDDLEGLLDQFEDDATVDLGRYELTVRTSNATLYGFNSRGFWTPDAATDLPLGRVVAADRPLVVGVSPELRKGYAVWDQAGFAWRLDGNLDIDEATVLALSVIAKLADLPRDLTR